MAPPPPERRTPIWAPPPDLTERMGDVSGNDVNGLGETQARRPHIVMWSWTEPFAHKPMQDLIAQRHLEHPEIGPILRIGSADSYRPRPVAEEAVERTPDEWADQIRHFALEGSDVPVEDVGIARVRGDWVYEGQEVSERWAVLLVVAMDHGELAQAPEWPAGAEVQRQYNRGTAAARAMADWIRGQGFTARGHGGPSAGPMLMIPAAISAGLGELGKHGSMIHPRLGSSFRLACVLTDLPLEPDSPVDFGADEFCTTCRICLDACPPGAIFSQKQEVRGESKWYVDFDRCLPYFAETHACGVCIAVCPWSKPGQAPRLADAMQVRRDRRQRVGES